MCYGVGVFEPASTIALRYKLSKQVYVEVASGVASSLDIFLPGRDFRKPGILWELANQLLQRFQGAPGAGYVLRSRTQRLSCFIDSSALPLSATALAGRSLQVPPVRWGSV